MAGLHRFSSICFHFGMFRGAAEAEELCRDRVWSGGKIVKYRWGLHPVGSAVATSIWVYVIGFLFASLYQEVEVQRPIPKFHLPANPSSQEQYLPPHNPSPFVQAALTLTSPSSPATLPASHSRPSPFPLHLRSRSSLSRSPLSHFATSCSLNPASRNRCAPFSRHAARSRKASREFDQSSSFPPSSPESERATSARGLYDGSLKRRSIVERFDDAAPRPRGRILGGGAGPRKEDRGSSESEWVDLFGDGDLGARSLWEAEGLLLVVDFRV